MLKMDSSYNQLNPSRKLSRFIDSYWVSENMTNKPLKRTIFPDSFFKITVTLINGKISSFFLTGLWNTEKEIEIPANATIYGVKFKILAPEYILKREIASLLQSIEFLQPNFWDIRSFNFDSLEIFVKQLEAVILNELKQNEKISKKKLQLSQLIYKSEGNILVKNIANKVGWNSRDINRYFTKYLGISLKSYLNIQKVYTAYTPIINKEFYPDNGFFDQPHLIREIKKHTHNTPKQLESQKDDEYIQLKNIKKNI